MWQQRQVSNARFGRATETEKEREIRKEDKSGSMVYILLHIVTATAGVMSRVFSRGVRAWRCFGWQVEKLFPWEGFLQ